MNSNATTLPAAYPLYWPEEWPRTPYGSKKRSRYDVTYQKASTEALQSLKRMRVSQWSLSSNLRVQRNLPPTEGAAAREDSGAALWWIDPKRRETRVIACDMYESVRENVRAIGLAIEALRALERTGATQILDRAMQTFATKGLPAPKPEWVYALGLVDYPASQAHVHEAFRSRSKLAHPDSGGSHQSFIELQQARDAALAWLGGRHG
jgi:hypothetical protein